MDGPPTNPGQTILDEQLDAAAKTLKLTLQRSDAHDVAKLNDAFAAALEQRVDAVFVYPLPVAPSERQRIAEFGITHRLPTVAISPFYVDAGMLVAYGVSPMGLYRRLGTYVDKILRGAKPADIPVEQPTTFELGINLRTAKALGLSVPQSILQRADRVIQ